MSTQLWDHGLGLRDGSLETWSQPKKSKKLESLHNKKMSLAGKARMPNLHSKEAVASHAQEAVEEKRLTLVCQKSPAERTEDEVRYLGACIVDAHS